MPVLASFSNLLNEKKNTIGMLGLCISHKKPILSKCSNERRYPIRELSNLANIFKLSSSQVQLVAMLSSNFGPKATILSLTI